MRYTHLFLYLPLSGVLLETEGKSRKGTHHKGDTASEKKRQTNAEDKTKI